MASEHLMRASAWRRAIGRSVSSAAVTATLLACSMALAGCDIAADQMAGEPPAAAVETEQSSDARTNRNDAGEMAGRSSDAPTTAETEPGSSASSTAESDIPNGEDGNAEQIDDLSASWQAASSSGNLGTIKQWYDDHTGISGAGLERSELVETGTIETERDGQVIDNMLVRGSIKIRHDNVTVRNSMIIGDGGWYALYSPHDVREQTRTINVENVEIKGYGADKYRMAIMYWPGQRLKARGVRILGHGGGMRLHAGSVVEYTYVGDIQLDPGSHNAAMSTRGGDHIVLQRSYLEGSTSSALSLYSDSPITDFLARENLFDGGTYSVHGGNNKAHGGDLADIRFINNKFTRAYQYGPLATWSSSAPGNVWSGNTYLDDGSAVAPSAS